MPTPVPGREVIQVAAVAENGVIGNHGDIPWKSPRDFVHFKNVTTGHPLILGRTTFEGIGRPLPNRQSIVITSDPDWSWEGVWVARGIEAALALAAQCEGDIMIGGGAGVYSAAMPYATQQILSLMRVRPEGDTHYPDWDPDDWAETAREEYFAEDVPRAIVWLRRR